MRMTYEVAIKRFPLGERRRIEEKLRILVDSSELGLQARANLRLESRLSSDAWGSLFRALLAVEAEPQGIKVAMTQSLRPGTLQAPEVPLPRSVVLGRAVTVGRFYEMLVTLGYFATTGSAERAVGSLLWRFPEAVPGVWRRRELGRFVMWSTFHPDRTSGPFDDLPFAADTIRAYLGLAPADRGKPLLLLEYSLPPGLPARYPTVAEAYAGDEWSYFFRPSDASDPYGKTLPWPEPGGMTPRPEVVHGVIRGDRLIAARECP
jgi:hypothetical protein